MVQAEDGTVGHDVAGYAAFHEDGLQRLPELAPVDDGPAFLVVAQCRQQATGAVQGVASHPGPGGVGPGTSEGHLHPHAALATDLQGRVGRLAEDGGIPRHEVRPLGEQVA